MIIKNGKLITWEEENQILENNQLLIQDGMIKEIGPDLEKNYPDEEVVDAGDSMSCPEISAPILIFMALLPVGWVFLAMPPRIFPEILEKLWWPLDMALDEDGVRYSALVFAVDAIKNGTTTLFDHHASPNYIDGSLDVIGDVLLDAGLRGVSVLRSD